MRLKLFKGNFKVIQEHNRQVQRKIRESNGELTADDFVELGINEYMDWTKQEKESLADLGQFFK